MQDRPLIIVLIVLGVIVPGIVAFGIVYVFGFKARYAIKHYREHKYQHEVAARMLLDASRTEELTMEQEMAREQELKNLVLGFYIKTNFFYFLDSQFGDPDKAASVFDLVYYSSLHFGFAAFSAAPCLVFALLWLSGRDMYVCPLEADEAACRAAWPAPSLVAIFVVVIYIVITLLELYSFYAALPWNFARKQLRRVWYTAQGVISFFSGWYLLTLLTWAFIGLLFRPMEFLPFALGILLTGVVAARFVYRSNRILVRIQRSIAQRGEVVVGQLMGHLPRDIVEAMIKAQTEKVLRLKRVTFVDVFNKMMLLVFVIVAALVFLFFAFLAFTDPNDLTVVKAIMSVVTLVAIDGLVNARQDRELLAADINEMSREIVEETLRRIHFVVQQIEMGQLLLKQLDEAEAKANKEEVEEEVRPRRCPIPQPLSYPPPQPLSYPPPTAYLSTPQPLSCQTAPAPARLRGGRRGRNARASPERGGARSRSSPTLPGGAGSPGRKRPACTRCKPPDQPLSYPRCCRPPFPAPNGTPHPLNHLNHRSDGRRAALSPAAAPPLSWAHRALRPGARGRGAAPPPPLVLGGHAASLTPY